MWETKTDTEQQQLNKPNNPHTGHLQVKKRANYVRISTELMRVPGLIPCELQYNEMSYLANWVA